MRRPLLLSLALAGAILQPAHAQTTAFNPAEVTAACAAGDCANTVATVVAAMQSMGLSPDETNTQIGFLASVLIDAAKAAPSAALADYATALALLAAASGDPAQRAAIEQSAAAVAAGDAGSIDTSSPIGASAA